MLPAEQDPHAKAGKFGFAVDNTIGATPQPNGWMDDWVEFYRERRIRHQLQLLGEFCKMCDGCGLTRQQTSGTFSNGDYRAARFTLTDADCDQQHASGVLAWYMNALRIIAPLLTFITRHL
jgi:hypothetical protein